MVRAMSTTIDTSKLEAFVGQIVHETGAAASAQLVVIGDRLGLYRAMADGTPVTPADLASRTATNERYITEWLGNQAAGGYVEYDAAAGTYALPPEHAAVLADDESPLALAGVFQTVLASARSIDQVTEAFRTGDGVGWGEHHCGVWHGVERFYGGVYRGHLLDAWLPSLDGVVDKLRSGAMVADVGSGHGLSTILMAEAFPRSAFTGYDLHAESVATARERAREAIASSPSGRNVRFEVADAASIPAYAYDLVTTFDALHDIGDPAAAARQVRRAIAEDGTWMIVEPRAGDSVAENLNPVGRFYYAASTMICTPGSLAQEGGIGLGAQAGPAKLTSILNDAGFSRVRIASETPFNIVLEARP